MTSPKTLLGWSINKHKAGYWRAFRRIGGKSRCVYLGMVFDIEKAMGKLQARNSEIKNVIDGRGEVVTIKNHNDYAEKVLDFFSLERKMIFFCGKFFAVQQQYCHYVFINEIDIINYLMEIIPAKDRNKDTIKSILFLLKARCYKHLTSCSIELHD